MILFLIGLDSRRHRAPDQGFAVHLVFGITSTFWHFHESGKLIQLRLTVANLKASPLGLSCRFGHGVHQSGPSQPHAPLI